MVSLDPSPQIRTDPAVDAHGAADRDERAASGGSDRRGRDRAAAIERLRESVDTPAVGLPA